MGLRCRRATLAHADVADAAALRLTSAYTIEAFFKLDRLPDAGETFVVCCKGGLDATTKACWYFAYRNNGGTLEWINGFVDTGGTTRSDTDVQTLTVGRWYAVHMSWDDATDTSLLRVSARATSRDEAASYVGVSQRTFGAVTPFASTEPVRIGCGVSSAGIPQDGFDGVIDEVRIYDTVIGVATLNTRLGTRLTGTEANLIGYWRLDDGAGGYQTSTAYDRDNGTGRNATLRNGASWADDPLDLLYPIGALTSGSAFLGLWSATYRPEAVITASQEDSGYPASNLRSRKQIYPTRTTDATGAKTWTFDFGEDPAVVWAVTIENHNLSSGAVVTIALNSADSWGAPAYAAETVTVHPQRIRHFLTRPQQYRYARLSVTDASAAGGYVELGTVDFWDGVEVYDGDRGVSVQVRDPSEAVEVPHGQRTPRSLDSSVDLACSFRLRRGQALHVLDQLRRMGGGGAVWLAPDPARQLYAGAVGSLRDLPAMRPADPAWTRTEFEVAVRADRP